MSPSAPPVPAAPCIPQQLLDAAAADDAAIPGHHQQQRSPVRENPGPEPASTCAEEQHSGTGTAGAPPTQARATSSVFARDDSAPVHVVPMRVIHRPLPSELDEDKVLTFMDEMRAGDVFTPIEVVKVRAPLKANPLAGPQNFYFAMGGCHRYEATKRLQLESIRARIIEVPPAAMRVYLGATSPF